MSAAVGGAPPTHGHSDSVNGRNPTIPAIPSVNGNVSLPDHTRKPSMTVTPAGATGFTANGAAPGGSQNKPGIQFGSMGVANPAGSPAIGTPPSLAHPNAANLSVSQLNPRATSPSNSPSPIPQPVSVSGGRPPSGFQGQGNGYTFGQMPVDPNDPTVRPRSNTLSRFILNILGLGSAHISTAIWTAARTYETRIISICSQRCRRSWTSDWPGSWWLSRPGQPWQRLQCALPATHAVFSPSDLPRPV